MGYLEDLYKQRQRLQRMEVATYRPPESPVEEPTEMSTGMPTEMSGDMGMHRPGIEDEGSIDWGNFVWPEEFKWYNPASYIRLSIEKGPEFLQEHLTETRGLEKAIAGPYTETAPEMMRWAQGELEGKSGKEYITESLKMGAPFYGAQQFLADQPPEDRLTRAIDMASMVGDAFTLGAAGRVVGAVGRTVARPLGKALAAKTAERGIAGAVGKGAFEGLLKPAAPKAAGRWSKGLARSLGAPGRVLGMSGYAAKEIIKTPFGTGIGRIAGEVGKGSLVGGWKSDFATKFATEEEAERRKGYRIDFFGDDDSQRRAAFDIGWGLATDIPIVKGLMKKTSKLGKNIHNSSLMKVGGTADGTLAAKFEEKQVGGAQLYKDWDPIYREGYKAHTVGLAAKPKIKIQDVSKFDIEDSVDIMRRKALDIAELAPLTKEERAFLKTSKIHTIADLEVKDVEKVFEKAEKGELFKNLKLELTKYVGRPELAQTAGGWANLKTVEDEMKHWELYQDTGRYVGPLNADELAGEIARYYADYAAYMEKAGLGRAQILDDLPDVYQEKGMLVEGLGEMKSRVLNTKAGRYLFSHPNMFGINEEAMKTIHTYIEDKFGERSGDIVKNIRIAMKEPYLGITTSERKYNIISRKSYVDLASANPLKAYSKWEDILKKSGLELKQSEYRVAAKEIAATTMRAYSESNAKYGIISLKDTLGRKLPAFNRLEKFYETMRFSLRPLFHLQQLPESLVFGSMDITHFRPLARPFGANMIAQSPVKLGGLTNDERKMFQILGAEPEFQGWTYNVRNTIHARQAHFGQEWLKEVERTPWFKNTAKLHGYNNAEEIPEVKRILEGGASTRKPTEYSANLLEEAREMRPKAYVKGGQTFKQEAIAPKISGELSEVAARARKAETFEDFAKAEGKRLNKAMGVDIPKERMRKIYEQATVGDLEAQWETIVKPETILRAWDKTRETALPVVLYSATRTPVEQGLHRIMFPFSYTKKLYGKTGKFLLSGKTIRPTTARLMTQGYQKINEKIEDEAAKATGRARAGLSALLMFYQTFNPWNMDYPISLGGYAPFPRAMFGIADYIEEQNRKKEEIDWSYLTEKTVRTMFPTIREWFYKYGKDLGLPALEDIDPTGYTTFYDIKEKAKKKKEKRRGRMH